MAVAISVAAQDVWPPRVQVSVTGLTLGDSVEVYREVASERTAVRGASDPAVDDPAFVRIDAELPFGVPVLYVAVVNDADEYATSATTYELPGGKVALTDAVTGASAEVVIRAEADRQYDRGSTRFKVAGRNVVVSGEWGQFEGAYEIYTETTSQHANLMELLADATEGVVQVRNASGTRAEYLAVDGASVARWSQDGSDERRLTTLQVAETEAWADELEARGYTLQDIADYYGVSGTLQDIADDFTTLLSIAQGDFS